jgi:hypothetical protein
VDNQGRRHWKIRWSVDGDPLGSKAKQRVEFESHHTARHINARVTDADGLSAAGSKQVGVTVTGPPKSQEF